METGEVAGEIMTLLLSRTNKQGKEFTDECISVLTLCMSEIIRSSFCSGHYQDAIAEINRQIYEDLPDDN